MAAPVVNDPTLIQPNAEHRYEVGEADLPLSCPMPGMYLWNSHPRVYLAIEATGDAKCPYCGAEYVLRRARRAS
ncbi:MAG TPA: zinc-finger domain-containing protein [Steroidobacteraceae bacterium]|nr:zinc-finger domain-containing protein [Steroidobacteraceae bacterium]